MGRDRPEFPSASVLAAHARYGSEVITVLEPEGEIRWENSTIYRLLGHRPKDVEGTDYDPGHSKWTRFVHPEDTDGLLAAIAGCLATPGESPPVQYRIRHADGSWRWFESRGVNLTDDPEVAGVVVSTRDVTERKRLEEELAHLATHDPLTNLPNRRLFEDRLEHALTRSRRSGQPLAVLFIDLDDFKPVNDGHGHDAGDELLVAVARRLEASLRPEDTICRLGGDEFVVLLEEVDRATATEVAERIVGRLNEPFELSGRSGARPRVRVTKSIGVALTEPGSAGRYSSADLLREADAAMYRAKRSGKARYELSVLDG